MLKGSLWQAQETTQGSGFRPGSTMCRDKRPPHCAISTPRDQHPALPSPRCPWAHASVPHSCWSCWWLGPQGHAPSQTAHRGRSRPRQAGLGGPSCPPVGSATAWACLGATPVSEAPRGTSWPVVHGGTAGPSDAWVRPNWQLVTWIGQEKTKQPLRKRLFRLGPKQLLGNDGCPLSSLSQLQ